MSWKNAMKDDINKWQEVLQRDDVTRVEAHFAIGEVRAVGGSRAFSCLSDVKVGSSIVAKSSLLVFSNFIWNQTNGVNQKTHVKKVVVFFCRRKVPEGSTHQHVWTVGEPVCYSGAFGLFEVIAKLYQYRIVSIFCVYLGIWICVCICVPQHKACQGGWWG